MLESLVSSFLLFLRLLNVLPHSFLFLLHVEITLLIGTFLVVFVLLLSLLVFLLLGLALFEHSAEEAVEVIAVLLLALLLLAGMEEVFIDCFHPDIPISVSVDLPSSDSRSFVVLLTLSPPTEPPEVFVVVLVLVLLVLVALIAEVPEGVVVLLLSSVLVTLTATLLLALGVRRRVPETEFLVVLRPLLGI